MAKAKINIDQTALERAIEKIEGDKNPPTTQRDLWEKVAKQFEVSASLIFNRVREYGIKIKTPSARGKGRGFPTPNQNTDIFEPFTRRGIVVKSIADITASVDKEDWHNIAIRDAWREIRRTEGLLIPDWEAINRRQEKEDNS